MDSKDMILKMEEVKKNAPELLEQMYKNHKETGENSVYEITDDFKLNKLNRKEQP